MRLSRGAAVAAVALALGAIGGSAPATASASQALRASSLASGTVSDFYRARGGAPLWFAPGAGNASQQLLLTMSTARADNLNPKRYRVNALANAVKGRADRQSGRRAAR